MAITIRNKRTEAMIREIGQRTGEGPSALLHRLAKEALEREAARERREQKTRLESWDALDEAFPPPTEAEKAEMRKVMETMYDYLDPEAARGTEPKKRQAP
jgi:hypothetical protein